MVKTIKDPSLPVACLCQKCGYAWFPKNYGTPKTCPRCKSYAWNRAYKRVPAKVKREMEERT